MAFWNGACIQTGLPVVTSMVQNFPVQQQMEKCSQGKESRPISLAMDRSRHWEQIVTCVLMPAAPFHSLAFDAASRGPLHALLEKRCEILLIPVRRATNGFGKVCRHNR
jgi:hypothetical protein